ncbi:MAG TPA: TIGR03000 domain-containing protein [Vicinamibacterales bacterium]|nr:TIGR03000 domain-containing protein [Vicinamibacterales bacterium]
MMLPLVLLLLAPAPLPQAQQAPAAATASAPAVLTITAPAFDAQLELDGKPLGGTGTTRTLSTPPLEPGRSYQSTLVAKWDPNTYTKMTRTKTITVRAGERLKIDLTVDDPTDRVSVMYVPTPDFVVAEMVKLAAITPQDVTYEPGVGDARITIAAVKAGARRGVGIDLAADRVAESRENVKKAGLSDKIDIRHGDALEQPDLGSMTVVLLYMGDHFNMLIRPYLWRQLPVGARVVSHRFLMGDDWPPDRTVTVNDEYGTGYDVHLWTITEAHKRRK